MAEIHGIFILKSNFTGWKHAHWHGEVNRLLQPCRMSIYTEECLEHHLTRIELASLASENGSLKSKFTLTGWRHWHGEVSKPHTAKYWPCWMRIYAEGMTRTSTWPRPLEHVRGFQKKMAKKD